ncbi:alpha/beta hydrolase [Mitsuaria sp. 7]|uniref:alpha/beta hydrolase n=1 Tax=Mitsuaria sp. 7 TaxID=1658665 RepID=UPI0007DD2C3B|nr:alpha/beta hydrolase [Mitsuaria sp. 7]ANH67466.1 esterase [Mitsuaria sp. 7]
MTDQKPGIALGARTIPFPRSISEEARGALERLVGEDGIPLYARHEMPAPDDVASWMKMKAAAGAQYAAAMSRLAGTLHSTIETRQVLGATLHVATPHQAFDQRVALIDLHGGALVFGGGEACQVGARRQADLHGVACYGVDYRMPPEHPYPAALDDCVVAYRHVLDQHLPEQIVIIGRSAGGNLAAALLLRCREEGLPMPAGLVLLSPEVDLTESGDSFQTHQMVDVVLPRSLMSNNLLYANGADLADPHLSPLFGDLRGFPPTFLQCGTRDLFLSNTVRMHRALRQAGVDAELHVFEAMPHGGFQGGTAEDQELDREVQRFIRARVPPALQP